MKRIVIILISSISLNFAIAQLAEDDKINLTGELNLGNYVGLDYGLNYVIKGKYSFKVGFTGNVRRPKSQPSDYKPGFLTILSFGLASPYDQMTTYQIGVGKIFKGKKSEISRTNFFIGLGYTTIAEPKNWQGSYSTTAVGNYTWDYNKHKTISLIINPKIELPSNRFYKWIISPMLQVNKDRAYAGIGLGNMLRIAKFPRKEKTKQENGSE